MIKRIVPFTFLLGTLMGLLSGCSTSPSESTETTLVTEDEFKLSRPGGWHRPRRPPPRHCKDLCEVRHIECGDLKHGWRTLDCGECADDETCQEGKCVADACEPDGTFTDACDGSDLVRTDNCDTEVEVTPCAYGCADNACIPPRCGDGVSQAEIDEQCDDGNAVDNDECTNGCKLPFCGDGITQANEACDDGNAVNEDGCTNGCALPACPDGIVQAGEACDDGNNENADGCTNTCTSPRCGDGVRQADEPCDDGNLVNEDGCTETCALARCGDGYTQPSANEACDDGNAVNEDGCTNGCELPRCGDGITQATEECDDANADNTDACTNTCKAAVCGDAFTQTSEECDDGNVSNTDFCTNQCKTAVCGDAFTQPGLGEQCDDGNVSNADFCTNQCKNAVCGDGYVQPGESCDDGNSTNGDGCGMCALERKLAFITSELFNGNLGGLTGADEKCQTLAQSAGLPGNYKAWLASSTESPNTRFVQHPGPYTTVTGVKIADSYADLTDGTLDAALNETEWGTPPPIDPNITCGGGGFQVAWSNATFNGTLWGSACNDWTSISGFGLWGLASQTSSSWASWCSGGTCAWTAPIYCFQQ